MNSRKNHFLVPASHQFPNLRKRHRRLDAPASASNGRNDAERTIRVTAILDFYNGAGSTTRSLISGRLQLVLEKNAATDDLRTPRCGKFFLEQVCGNFAN